MHASIVCAVPLTRTWSNLSGSREDEFTPRLSISLTIGVEPYDFNKALEALYVYPAPPLQVAAGRSGA